jgi:cytochrome c biogenesis protein
VAGVRTATRQRGYEIDPLRWLWRLLTSVRIALAIIGVLALGSLVGVLVPQLPVEMRGNPAGTAAWLAFQEERRFGFLTDPMYRLGLFEVFRSIWFVGALGALVVSVCVCTANRLPPVWRNVREPQTRAPDEYYAHGGVALPAGEADAESLSRELRRRRYRVTVSEEAGATYLFADRYPWAQLATFVSHLALILFLAGGLVTMISAKESQVFAAEGESGAPVFSTADSDHMQVHVLDAVGRFDDTGFPLDFRTALVVYKDGQEVARGVTTVNSPLSYGGFKFHQSAYFPDGAALQVREVASGRVVYDEVLALISSATTPRIVVRNDAGEVVLDDVIVPTDFFSGVAGTLVTIPSAGREFWIGARPAEPVTEPDMPRPSGRGGLGWQLVVFETARPDGARSVLAEGERRDLGGLSLSFVGMEGVPSTTITGLPGADSESIAELSNGPSGPLLTVGPVQGRALALSPGEPVVIGDYAYSFEGQREFAGITVRRDPGSTFIWVATGLFLAGLALTFYTPRRRLWGKIAQGTAVFRGLGGRTAAIEREVHEAIARSRSQGT